MVLVDSKGISRALFYLGYNYCCYCFQLYFFLLIILLMEISGLESLTSAVQKQRSTDIMLSILSKFST